MFRTIYFLEDYWDSLCLDDGYVVSVRPEVSFWLGHRHISYRILEDHYSEAEMRAYQEAYFFQQLEWVNRLDHRLRENIPELQVLGIHPLRAHFSRMKFVLDTLVIRAYAVGSLLDKVPAEKVIYARKSRLRSSVKSVEGFGETALDLLFNVVSEQCRSRDLIFEEVNLS